MNRHLLSVIDIARRALQHRTIAERHASEYWSRFEPYRSSGRAFGHIELINRITTPNGTALAVRGWIFDKYYPLTNLRIMIPRGTIGTTIANLQRKDVAANMRSYGQSLASGFLSLIPVKEPCDELALGASYKAGEEQINVIFENTPVSLGVALPGEVVRASCTFAPSDGDVLALVLLPNWSPEPSSLTSVIERYANSETTLAVFSDLSTQQLNELSNSAKWHTRTEASISEIASTLLQWRASLRHIVVTGSVTNDIFLPQFFPILAHTPIPSISWIIPTSENLHSHALLPQHMRGNLVEWICPHSA